MKILTQNPFYKTAKPGMKKCCPMCNLSISRVVQHLRRKHNLTGVSLYMMSKRAKKIHFQESDYVMVKLGNPKTFQNVRNHLLIRIFIENSCSPFAIQHLDLNNGSHEDKFMLSKIIQRKTMSDHSDGHLLSSEIMPILKNYLRVRELFQKSQPKCFLCQRNSVKNCICQEYIIQGFPNKRT